MNTNANTNMQSEIYDARKALGGYLERTDLLLARSGLTRKERDETLGQIAEQFYDLLGVPIEEADRELTENAIARLAPERAFELFDTMTPGQRLRAALQLFWIAGFIPYFLNDHGRKHVVWRELIKRVVLICLFMVILLTTSNMMMNGNPSWKWFPEGFILSIIPVVMGLRGFYEYHRTAVEAMPRAEDWSAAYRHQTRHARMLMSAGNFLFIFALFLAFHWLFIDSRLFVDSQWIAGRGLHVVIALILVLSIGIRWRKHYRKRRFQNWDRQGDAS